MEQGFRIGFINSSKQHLECALSAAAKLNIKLETSLTGLDQAVPVGLDMEKEGVEVIITRYGIASLMRKKLKIPILSVRISFSDLFLNVREASLLGQKILLTSANKKMEGVDLLQKLFKVTLIPVIFQDANSLEKAIVRGKKQGCHIVIGGGDSISLAEKHGLRGVELSTNENSIITTIEDALSVARANREEQAKTLRYRTIMDSSSEGIIALDNQGIITAINLAALQFLGLSEQMVGKKFTAYNLGGYVREVLDSGRPILNKLEKLRGEMFVTNYIPLQLGADVLGEVITFRDVPNVIRAENDVRRFLVKGFVAKQTIENFVHCHPAMKEVVKKVRKFSQVESTLLITGETGTGKEIIAQSIQTLGPRRNGPFVSINCAAIPDQLLESELFGYEEGAFTGSRHGGKPGLFELAHNGTIFLDEVGATPLSVQSRLLRVLQEHEVMRIGGDRLISVNVRVIAATNQNLCLEVQKGRFREDLYFRLDVLTIHLPPLRERIDDLPILVQDLIRRCTRNPQTRVLTIPEQHLKKLMELPWPGNVRQLHNFVEKLVILSEDGYRDATFEELYADLLNYSMIKEQETIRERHFLAPDPRGRPSDDESSAIRKALEESRFSRTLAAKRLGVSRTTLWRKLREMGMNLPTQGR